MEKRVGYVTRILRGNLKSSFVNKMWVKISIQKKYDDATTFATTLKVTKVTQN